MDEIAANAIARLTAIPIKETYGRTEIAALLDGDFEELSCVAGSSWLYPRTAWRPSCATN
jgi:hypothetical protein